MYLENDTQTAIFVVLPVFYCFSYVNFNARGTIVSGSVIFIVILYNSAHEKDSAIMF